MQLALPHVAILHPRPLRDFLDIRASRSVLIHDSWLGYDDRSPICTVYDLRRRNDGGFTGAGTFSSRFGGHPPLAVEIAEGEATAFLDSLGSALLTGEPYQPRRMYADDYPRIELVLHVPPSRESRGGVVQLFTESHGDEPSPWCVFVGGVGYSSSGDEIGHAFRLLDVPLRRAEGRALLSEEENPRSS